MARGLIASWTIGVALLVAVAMPGLMDMVQPVDHEVREWAVSAERDVPMAVAKV